MNDFIKNPQTRNARACLPLNISDVVSVIYKTKASYFLGKVYQICQSGLSGKGKLVGQH